MEDVAQMVIPNDMVEKLQNKGIRIVAELIDFDKYTIKHIFANRFWPSVSIPCPNPGGVPGATIHMHLFVFGYNSQKRLVVAAKLLR